MHLPTLCLVCTVSKTPLLFVSNQACTVLALDYPARWRLEFTALVACDDREPRTHANTLRPSTPAPKIYVTEGHQDTGTDVEMCSGAQSSLAIHPHARPRMNDVSTLARSHVTRTAGLCGGRTPPFLSSAELLYPLLYLGGR